MGKNGRFGKIYGKVVGADKDDGRPGWKGPAFVKKMEQKPKAKPQSSGGSKDELEEAEPNVSVELQQLLLNIFRDTFVEVLTSGDLKPLLQQVKTALFERDFERAFGNSRYLEAYSARWSPSRALCYHSVLVDIQEHLDHITIPVNDGLEANASENQIAVRSSRSVLSSVCFGGGAAEVVAFGSYVRGLRDASQQEVVEDETEAKLQTSLNQVPKIEIALIDSAGWKDVVQKLHDGLHTPPFLSKYASASAKAANKALLPNESLDSKFIQDDLLAMNVKQLEPLVGGTPKILTLLFTLNELYTSSISKTTAFLLNLTMATQSGTLLLVVDSPGTYSTTSVGAEAKKYPMKFLLDHTLLDTEKTKAEGDDRRRESPASWVKLVSEDAKWFRIPEELRYSIPMENMRYQIHLYRRI
jgi:25S rRNA (uracil2843-N3)-methyltransferase